MQTRPLIAVLTAAAVLSLGACASKENDAPEPVTSGSSQVEGQEIEVAIEGDSISPNGARVEGEVGKAFTFVVTSDRAGTIHVHTQPGQEFEYGVGTTRFNLTIDRPGIVEVEDHEAGTVVVQLQVS